MREILFRAKAINRDSIDGRCRRTDYKNGDWVYGLITKPYNEEYDFPAEMRNTDGVTGIEVDYKTIGQYTGLTDKNDVKIFEGDVVKGTAYSGKFVGIIVWIDEIGGFGVRYKKRQEATAWENSSILKCASKRRTDEFTAEIIGNVFDTPELIIGGDAE